MSATRRCLVLVDGSSYLYRAFHAMPSLTNSKGDPTGAAYGMTNMLKRLETEVQPELAAVIFDAKGKTFRDDLYPEYKANRAPMPTELRAQLQSIHALVRALGFPVLEVGGVEADDVIGTLAELGKKAGLDVLVSTGDKDMAQLVDDHVTMVNTMDGAVLDAAGVEAKFGVPPESIVDYLTLVGDTVDNVPGVPKVGPKTAVKWLAQYRTVEDVVVHADEIKGKVGENLRASLEQIPLSKELVTIRRDVELDVGPLDLELRELDTEALKALYGELEFRTWLGELLGAGGDAPAEAPAADYETVLDETALDAWIERLGAAGAIAFDTETTSLDYMQAELVGVSFAVEPGHAAYVPFGHDYPGAPEQLAGALVLERLRPILESEWPAKIGQNLKYDMSVLARAGIALNGIGFDTMLESYVLDSTATRHDMDSLALKYLGHRTIHYEDIAGKGAKQLSFNQVPVEDAGPYAAEGRRRHTAGFIGCCVRGSKSMRPSRSCATRWRCRSCRCSRAWSATECGSTSGGCTSRAPSSPIGCARSRRPPTQAPAGRSTSDPRSRSGPSCTTSSSCRCARRPPRVSRPPRSRRCRSSPSTTSCRSSSSSTGR